MADGFHLGKLGDGGELVLDPDDLTTHAVIVGMTGSGKTSLGIVLLEEALGKGIPALILDEVAEIDEKWAAKADAVETVPIRLEAGDVRVVETTLVWVPTA